MIRLACFTSFASKTKRYVILDLKPSLFRLQTQHLLCTNTTVSPKQSHTNFTVNYLINSCGLSPEDAISASKWVKLQSQEKADSVLVSLRNNGFSESQITQVVRGRPQILSCKFEKTVLRKIQYFTSVGLSAEDFAKIVASNPALLHSSLENQIIPNHKLLKSMLPHNSVTVLRRSSRILMAIHDTSVTPNISLLKQMGMSQSCVSMSLVHFTGLMTLKQESFAKLVCEAKEMGFNMKNTASLWAMDALRFKNTLNRSRQVCMMRWGWSEDDFLSAFRRCPKSALVSEKKLMQVMDFLVNKMGWPSVKIAKYPGVFLYSLEKRTVPRCSVAKVLMLQGLKNENLNLCYVVQGSDKQFLERFVTKYLDRVPQLLSVYQGNVDIQDAKVLVS